MKNKLSCVIVDDEESSLELLKYYFEQNNHLSLKAIFRTPLDALSFLLKNPVDLLITDINMPKLSGIELYQAVHHHSFINVIFVSGYSEKIIDALQVSAIDYLYKPFSIERFEEAVSKAIKIINISKPYDSIPSEVLELAFMNYPSLGKMEKRIIDLLSKGYSSNMIAEALFISKKTVENHRVNIRKKLHLSTEHNLATLSVFLTESVKK